MEYARLDALPDWAAPDRVLNPAVSPDAPWAMALTAGDPQAAIGLFVDTIRHRPFLPRPQDAYIPLAERWSNMVFGHNDGHDYDPDDVVRQHYVGVYGIAHTFDGDIDWMFDPTREWGERHTWEWQVQFNRHYQWIPLARAWERTGQRNYVEAFERELLSWVSSQCPAPPRMDMRLPGTWRTIEAGIRAGWTWPLAMEIFRRPGGASDLAIWLLVAALREHGRYLLMSPTGGNFKTMESNGLAHAGMLLPELLDAEVYASTAIDRAIAEMERQFYPDGCQDELASSYGRLSMLCTFCTLTLARHTGLDRARGTGIAASTWEKLGQMARVYGEIAAPDGRVPGLHDCDGIDVRNMVAELGSIPCTQASPAVAPWCVTDRAHHVPWGGYGILRRENRWSLLDAGPWGTGHQHHDALQVITWGEGDFWCIDPGRPAYDQSPETHLIRSAEGHNVVLMDGLRHRPDPVVVRTPTPFPMAVTALDGASIAAATRTARRIDDDGTGFRHERALMDVAGLGWLVIDRLTALAPGNRHWEWLWHLPERTSVSIRAQEACATRPDGARLHVFATANTALTLDTVTGSTDPLRGWAVENGVHEAHPIPLIVVRSKPLSGIVQCATLLSSTTGVSIAIDATRDATRITVPAQPLTITLTGEQEWSTMQIDRDGTQHAIALPPHSFDAESRQTTEL